MLDTHAKVWLWISFIGNILAALMYVRLISESSLYIAFFVLSILLAVSVSILLFMCKKLGFYLICCLAVIAFFLNVLAHVNFLFAVFGLFSGPLFTYLFLKSSWDYLF